MSTMSTKASNPPLFNAASYLVDRHLEGGYGSRTAVVTAQRTLTYAELAQEVYRVAGALRYLGLRPEERVMFCMADDVELLTGILGAMYLGAVPVPVSTMLTGPDLGTVLADSRARILCASIEFVGTVVAAVALAPEVTDVIFDGEPKTEVVTGIAVHRWNDLVSAVVPVSTAYETWADSPALWLYTSGTTGLPKAAMHPHGNIRAIAESYGAEVLGIQPRDRCLSVAKLFFAYGIGNSCFLPLSVGAAAILERERPTPAGIAERIRMGRPTLFFGVPTFFASMLVSDVPDTTFAGVRLGISAGEALPPALFERMGERFGVEVLDGIGATEALHIFLSNQRGCVRPGSSGVPVPGYEVQLRDDDDRVIEAAGLPGALYLRGISTATGYWCRAEATRKVFQGDWLRTGDMYVRNEDGTYSCLGRLGDMLKAGGIWVSPAEVEERLLRHPDVAEVAVVAAPDNAGLDKPVACVVPQPGRTVDADALIEWCREGLAAFKRPRAVVALDVMPRTPTGKIRRKVLRELVTGLLGETRRGVIEGAVPSETD